MTFAIYFEAILLPIAAIAFVTEFADAAFGMGFGTVLGPVLLILGFNAHDIVPPMLLAQLAAGLVVSLTHVLLKNVSLGQQSTFRYMLFDSRKKRLKVVLAPLFMQRNTEESLKENDYQNAKKKVEQETFTNNEEEIEEKRMEVKVDEENGEIDYKNKKLASKIKSLTRDTKAILILSAFAVVGVITAAIISVVFKFSRDFQFGANVYIAVMVLLMGLILLVYRQRKSDFSWSRIIGLGGLAGFNKGLSGGGFGPLMVVAQVISGRNSKNAVASTLMAETVASLMAIITYLITNVLFYTQRNTAISWEWLRLAPYLIVGAVLAAPFAALVTKRINEEKLKLISGTIMIVLSIFTLIRLILMYVGVWAGQPSFV